MTMRDNAKHRWRSPGSVCIFEYYAGAPQINSNQILQTLK